MDGFHGIHYYVLGCDGYCVCLVVPAVQSKSPAFLSHVQGIYDLSVHCRQEGRITGQVIRVGAKIEERKGVKIEGYDIKFKKKDI